VVKTPGLFKSHNGVYRQGKKIEKPHNPEKSHICSKREKMEIEVAHG